MNKQVPNVKFVIRPEKDFITITSDDIFKNKNIVLFALPGAFTELKKLGVDEVYCLSANDPFVMKAWAKNLDLKKVKMLPDANMEFTKAMDMVTDRSAAGMGQRSKRYSIYVKNKTIEKMFVDADGKFDVSDSNTMISFLKSQK